MSERYRWGFLGAAIVVGLGAFYLSRSPVLFFPDGYIYLAHARQFATTGTWGINPGETSFSVTSPLWAAICALFHFVVPSTDGYVRLMQVVGLATMAASLVALDALLQRLDVVPVLRGLVLVAFAALPLNGFFYAISAMETPLYLLLFFLAARVALGEASMRNAVLFGVLCGLMLLTRVEGAMCLPALAAVALTKSGRPWLRVHFIATTALAFLVVIAPWQLYLYAKTGGLVPTSGKGRLYLYFPFATLELADYLAQGFFARFRYLGEVVHKNFVGHPLILALGVLPTLGLVVLLALAARVRAMAVSPLVWRALVFLTVYNVLNLLLYLLFHPFIYQRYFIVALPSLMIATAITLLPLLQQRARMLAAVAAAGAVALAAVNVVSLRYFDTPIAYDSQLIGMFKRLESDSAGKPCRIAAEPLGLAAYFTHCYVIDMGGLINPDIWPVWIAAGRKRIDDVSIEYALKHGVDFLYWPGGSSPPILGERFSAYLRSSSGAIYQPRR